MGRADDRSRRARLDAAVGLCGSTSSSNANAPPAAAIHATAIQRNGTIARGAAISTPQPTRQAS
jgi:hypothetical protein